MKKRRLGFKSLLRGLFSLLFIPALLFAQQRPAGVVTALQGQAQLTRAEAQTPLRFKDGVLVRDVIDTKEQSLARILFGGKSTVTVRELTRLEVREEVLPTSATRSIHELSSGAILVKAARQLMRPGDEIQIRTPNAVASIRGTTVFAQYNPALNQSLFAFLSGSGIVIPQGLPPINLTANTPNNGANVTGSGANVQVNVVNVTPVEAAQILQVEAQVGKAAKKEANKEQVTETAMKEAASLASVMVTTVLKGERTATGWKKVLSGAGLTKGGDSSQMGAGYHRADLAKKRQSRKLPTP